jgi:hypothetical protein
MEPVLDIGCSICHMPRPLDENGHCPVCVHFMNLIPERMENKLTDPGPKPRGRKPKCPSCGKTCVVRVDSFSGKWNFYCPGPTCIDFCWNCSVYYPDDQFCPKCGSTKNPELQHGPVN